MRKTMSYVFMAMAFMFLAMPVFAQGDAAAAGTNWVAITSGFAMAIASGLCALGQGKATASATESLARNPAARPGILLLLVLGLALIESLALYTFLIIFLKVR